MYRCVVFFPDKQRATFLRCLESRRSLGKTVSRVIPHTLRGDV
jgi:hypothetical protein